MNIEVAKDERKKLSFTEKKDFLFYNETLAVMGRV
jgi:hypothetical protein